MKVKVKIRMEKEKERNRWKKRKIRKLVETIKLNYVDCIH